MNVLTRSRYLILINILIFCFLSPVTSCFETPDWDSSVEYEDGGKTTGEDGFPFSLEVESDAKNFESQTVSDDEEISIGSLSRGEYSDYIFTIKNKSETDEVPLSSPYISIEGSGVFEIEGRTPSGTIEGGGSTSFIIRAYNSEKAKLGEHTCSVTIYCEGKYDTVFTFSIYAKFTEKPEPFLEIYNTGNAINNGDAFGFGKVAYGNYRNEIFIIKNSGMADLELSGDLVITGSGASCFSISQTIVSDKLTLSKGESTTFKVRFTPSSGTDSGIGYSATLTLSSNDPEGKFIINLSGTGIAAATPKIDVQYKSDSGYKNINSPVPIASANLYESSSLEFRIANSSDDAILTIKSIELSDNEGNFSTNYSALNTTIIPSYYETFIVYFSPTKTTPGNKNATVTIKSDADNTSEFTFTISGKATAPVLKITDPYSSEVTDTDNYAKYNFGNVSKGDTAKAVFTVTNTGDSALEIYLQTTVEDNQSTKDIDETKYNYILITESTNTSFFSLFDNTKNDPKNIYYADTGTDDAISVNQGDSNSRNFIISFSPQSATNYEATVTICTSDPKYHLETDESDKFTFIISGAGTE